MIILGTANLSVSRQLSKCLNGANSCVRTSVDISEITLFAFLRLILRLCRAENMTPGWSAYGGQTYSTYDTDPREGRKVQPSLESVSIPP